MFKTFLIKYGEIAIKGKNRHLFEDALVRQIRHALKKCDGEFSVYKEQGRIYVDCEGMYDYEETVGHLQHVFGIVGICPVMQVEDHGIEELGDSVIEFLTNVYDIDAQTFKVNTRRANKQYPIESMEVKLDATYFHAPPYTSERAKQKVIDLAKKLTPYAGPINLHIVNFTDIQLYIYDKCPHDELTIIMRRYMMRIAEHFANETKSLALVTGESIGQVASQTMQSLAATNEVCSMPVFRPLIGFDKQEIIDVAEKIDTYETSILPFEDCCTIFVAKHPVTKPNLHIIQASEKKLSEKIDELVKTAIETTETVWVE